MTKCTHCSNWFIFQCSTCQPVWSPASPALWDAPYSGGVQELIPLPPLPKGDRNLGLEYEGYELEPVPPLEELIELWTDDQQRMMEVIEADLSLAPLPRP